MTAPAVRSEQIRTLYRQSVPVLPLPCDVTDRDQAGEMVDRVRDHFGSVDVLVNNAGTIAVGPLEVMTLEDFEEAMNTNFYQRQY